MAVVTTPLGFQKPDGNELVKQGDNVIATNAQKSQDLIGKARADIVNLQAAAGFDGDPVEMQDAVVAALVGSTSETSTAVTDVVAAYATPLRLLTPAPMAASVDLNTQRTTTRAIAFKNADASSGLNFPAPYAGRFSVDNYGTMTWQEYTFYAGAPNGLGGASYRRSFYNVTNARWTPWERVRAVNATPEPTVNIEKKTFGAIPYNIFTIRAGGAYRPGLLHKYLDITTAISTSPTLAREHYIDIARDLSGATVISNASGLIHLPEYPTSEGALVRLRGAQVVNGVARNDFPTDLYWTGYEACGVLANGQFKGYSGFRGDTVAGMVEDGVINTISSFGPILVENGAERSLSDPFWDTATGIISSINFIGQKPNGDVILVNAPGVTGTSGGTLADQTAIALSEGCVFAFSLDRGGSTQCWVGATPVVTSGDTGGRRLIADYLYTTAPISSPVPTQKIPLPLAANMSVQSASYPPLFWISSDNVVHFSGQVKKTDGATFATGTDVISVLPNIARPKTNMTGYTAGILASDASTRRWLYNVADTSLKILGATAVTSSYVDLSGISWQL